MQNGPSLQTTTAAATRLTCCCRPFCIRCRAESSCSGKPSYSGAAGATKREQRSAHSLHRVSIADINCIEQWVRLAVTMEQSLAFQADCGTRDVLPDKQHRQHRLLPYQPLPDHLFKFQNLSPDQQQRRRWRTRRRGDTRLAAMQHDEVSRYRHAHMEVHAACMSPNSPKRACLGFARCRSFGRSSCTATAASGPRPRRKTSAATSTTSPVGGGTPRRQTLCLQHVAPRHAAACCVSRRPVQPQQLPAGQQPIRHHPGGWRALLPVSEND